MVKGRNYSLSLYYPMARKNLTLIVKADKILVFDKIIRPLFDLFEEQEVKVKLPQLKKPIIVRPKTSDISVLDEIFFSRDYDLPLNFRIKTIVDAGANVGYSSIFFANKYPSARIIAIEPEGSNYRILKKNVSSFNNIVPIKSAIWNKKVRAIISNQDSADKWGFMVKEVNENLKNSFPTVTMQEVIKMFNKDSIDILKIDIEGSERELFSSNFEWLDKIKCIIIELHEKMRGGSIESFENALSRYRFKEIKLTKKYAKHLRLLVKL